MPVGSLREPRWTSSSRVRGTLTFHVKPPRSPPPSLLYYPPGMVDTSPHGILARFAELVATSPHNLVSRQARTELLTRHVPESAAIAEAIPPGVRRLLDVGTGGGFPGFVIAVQRPELDVHLVERSQKKAAFLEEAAVALDVSVTLHARDAGELVATELAGAFDVVTTRAVASLRDLLPLTVPFLSLGGELYAVKGARWEAELADAEPAFVRWGLEVAGVPDADLGDPSPGSLPRIVRLVRTTLEPPRRR